MNPPPELITVEQFAPVWTVLCALWTLGCLVACCAGVPRERGGRPRAGALALLGPLGWGLWTLYRARVAYDPSTGVAGLHKVSVFLTHLALFLIVGVAAGAAIGRLARRSRTPEAAEAGASPRAANKS